MLSVSSIGILFIRSGIIILAFFGCALLWVLSEPILPQSFLSSGLRVGVCAWLLLHAWDFSMRIGKPGGWLNRVLTDRAHQVNSGSVPMADASSLKTQDIDEKYFAQVAQEMRQDFMDDGPWVKACALAQGDELRQKSFYVELRARKLFKDHEAEVRRVHDADELNRKISQEAAHKLHRPEEAKRRRRLGFCAGIVTFCGMVAPGIGHSDFDYAFELQNLLIGVFYVGWVIIVVMWWKNRLWWKNHLLPGQPKHENVSTESVDHQT